MDETAVALSRTLDGLTRALAEWTVTRHAEQDVSLPGRYGAKWREAWVAAVHARLEYLSQSVAVRRPALFGGMVSWESSAFRARGTAMDDLRVSLECLHGVLSSELPQIARVLEPYLIGGLAAAADPTGDLARPAGVEGPLAAVTLGYIEAILDSRSNDALGLILQHARDGTRVTDLYVRVLGAAMAEIGLMWQRGEITVADEHMATATTQLALSMIRLQFPQDIRLNHVRVALAALGGDHHDLGLRMAADLLEMDGWDVRYIGANTPASEILDYLKREPAPLFTLSVGSCLHLRAAGELIESLANHLGEARPRVLIGGFPFQMVDDLWMELGADAGAHDLAGVPAAARRLIPGLTD